MEKELLSQEIPEDESLEDKAIVGKSLEEIKLRKLMREKL
jgi:hypothetical protein